MTFSAVARHPCDEEVARGGILAVLYATNRILERYAEG